MRAKDLTQVSLRFKKGDLGVEARFTKRKRSDGRHETQLLALVTPPTGRPLEFGEFAKMGEGEARPYSFFVGAKIALARAIAMIEHSVACPVAHRHLGGPRPEWLNSSFVKSLRRWLQLSLKRAELFHEEANAAAAVERARKAGVEIDRLLGSVPTLDFHGEGLVKPPTYRSTRASEAHFPVRINLSPEVAAALPREAL